jgi:hypothetical protein
VSFEFGDWDLFGIWDLEFGILDRSQSKEFSKNSKVHLA